MDGIGQGGLPSETRPTGHCILQDLLNDLPRLRALARSFARNDWDAHYLVQATFVRVLERAGRLRREDQKDSQALFVRIMKNLHVDGIRKRRPSTPLIEDELAAPAWSSIALWRRVSDEALKEAASTLADPYREVWALSYDGRMEQREIASALRIRRGTVATRVHRARLGLRARLTRDSE